MDAEDQNEILINDLDQQIASLQAQLEADRWIPVEEGLPKTIQQLEVIFTNSHDKRIIVLADYIPYRFILAEDYMSEECDSVHFDYDKETDTEWTKEGWYEWEYSTELNIYLNETITHYSKITLPGE